MIPAFNEERYIGSVVLHARESADAVVVVDDGILRQNCLDSQRAGAQVIRQGNSGYGGALSTGFRVAMSLRPRQS